MADRPIALSVFDDTFGLYTAGADHIAAAAEDALSKRGRFLLVLAGGSTPRGAYERLASRECGLDDLHRIQIFWGDERCVPPDHPESNYGMAAASLLRHLTIPSGNVHRIRGEQPAEAAAARYDAELAEFFGRPRPGTSDDTEPAFDLVLLGLGADGHTASLFPDSPSLEAKDWAVATVAPESAEIAHRVTLTLPALNAARECLFLVSGASKRHAVRLVVGEKGASPEASLLPAARVAPRGPNRWFLDAAAAEGL
jgi:6-phosphogluconolactonase